MDCIARGQILGDGLSGETRGSMDDNIEFCRRVYSVLAGLTIVVRPGESDRTSNGKRGNQGMKLMHLKVVH
jgi:hypothetical protein